MLSGVAMAGQTERMWYPSQGGKGSPSLLPDEPSDIA